MNNEVMVTTASDAVKEMSNISVSAGDSPTAQNNSRFTPSPKKGVAPLKDLQSDLEIVLDMIKEHGPKTSLILQRDRLKKHIRKYSTGVRKYEIMGKKYSETMAAREKLLDNEVVAALTPLSPEDREMLAEICTITHPAVLDENDPTRVLQPESKELNKAALIREGRLMTVLNRIARGKSKKGDGATAKYIQERNQRTVENNEVRGVLETKSPV